MSDFTQVRFTLAVPDLAVSTNYYTAVLGLTVHSRFPGWSFLSRGTFCVMLGECPDAIHVMAGIVPQNVDRHSLTDNYAADLRIATSLALDQGVDILIEPINTRDMPGYFLNRQDQAHELIESVGTPNLKIQMDLYHLQIVEGDIEMKLRTYLPTGNVGQLQIAGVPHRHEPDEGEVHFQHLFGVIDELCFAGWIGCEYRTKAGTTHGLAWLEPYL